MGRLKDFRHRLWRRYGYHELSLFPPEADLTKELTEAQAAYSGSPGWFMAYVLGGVVLGQWLTRVLARSKALSFMGAGAEYVGAVLAIAVLSAITYVSIGQWGRRRIRRALRQRLREHGVLVCLKCCYDLRGQTEPRCPECGTLFEPITSDCGSSPQASDAGGDTEVPPGS